MNKYHRYLEELVNQLGGEIPASPVCYDGLQTLPGAGALSARTKLLMGLALAIAMGGEDLIEEAVREAFLSGARLDEITESIGVAVLMTGNDAMADGAHAIETLVLLQEERTGYTMRTGA